MNEENLITDIVDILIPKPDGVGQTMHEQQVIEDKRSRLAWNLKDLINIAAAKGRSQIQ